MICLLGVELRPVAHEHWGHRLTLMFLGAEKCFVRR